ncbi:MAG: hypothetical protein ACQESF_07390 [Nanobdellota archaeon]
MDDKTEKKIVERLKKIAQEKKFGNITITYTISQKKIVKAIIKDQEKIELLD